MTIKQLSAKLRHAADVLDELIGIERMTVNETSHTASKILSTLHKRKYTKRKGKYNGKHWTQTPQGKAKMSKIVKASYRARRKALKAVA